MAYENGDELIAAVSANIQEKASLIWSVADTLRGPFKPHEYGLVILPMTVIKRFHDCLLPTHEKVQEAKKKYASIAPELREGFLKDASGYPFYNQSAFTFETLKADPANIEDNFRDYMNGFSENVQDILSRMNFDAMVDRLADPDAPLLYQVICDFCKESADMSPKKIKPVDMGYIFENLTQRFSESHNEDAGAHFTSRDIVYLMTDLLVAADPHVFDGDHISKTVYDQAMGTSQMLSCPEERLRQMDEDARVTTFGQEFNPFTYGITKTNALIRGNGNSNMQFGNTLSGDRFPGYTFDYCISNPPFGDLRNPQADAVTAENKKGASGRFAPGLPDKKDGQMLFALNGLSKLKDDGVMVIVQDASPLYKGDPESGSDKIRRYILENDWLDCIVQPSTDAFYNTGISTYPWIPNKNKAPERKDKVLLADAPQCFEKRRKSIGDTKNDITKQCRDLILKAYGEYVDGKAEYIDTLSNGKKIRVESTLIETIELGFNRVVVNTPEFDANGEKARDKKGRVIAKKINYRDADKEDVPSNCDINRYFERVVKPRNPDAWPDKKSIKTGYQIPFTKTFYRYQDLKASDIIAERILQHEKSLEHSLSALFGKGE